MVAGDAGELGVERNNVGCVVSNQDGDRRGLEDHGVDPLQPLRFGALLGELQLAAVKRNAEQADRQQYRENDTEQCPGFGAPVPQGVLEIDMGEQYQRVETRGAEGRQRAAALLKFGLDFGELQPLHIVQRRRAQPGRWSSAACRRSAGCRPNLRWLSWI